MSRLSSMIFRQSIYDKTAGMGGDLARLGAGALLGTTVTGAALGTVPALYSRTIQEDPNMPISNALIGAGVPSLALGGAGLATSEYMLRNFKGIPEPMVQKIVRDGGRVGDFIFDIAKAQGVKTVPELTAKINKTWIPGMLMKNRLAAPVAAVGLTAALLPGAYLAAKAIDATRPAKVDPWYVRAKRSIIGD